MCSQADKQRIIKILEKVRQMLLKAKDALDIYDGIRQKGSELDFSRSGRRFWLSVQGMAVESMNLNLCKVFGKSKIMRCQQNSISAVLEILKTANVCPDKLNKLSRQYIKFKNEKSGAFKKLNDARNNALAHSNQDNAINKTAPLADIDDIVTFGWDFCNSISEQFCSEKANFDSTQMTRCTHEILSKLYPSRKQSVGHC